MMTLVSYDVSTVDAAGRKRLRKVAKVTDCPSLNVNKEIPCRMLKADGFNVLRGQEVADFRCDKHLPIVFRRLLRQRRLARTVGTAVTD